MDFTLDFAFYFISPGIDFCSPGCLPDGWIVRVKPAHTGGQKFGNCLHHLVTDFIQLFPARSS